MEEKRSSNDSVSRKKPLPQVPPSRKSESVPNPANLALNAQNSSANNTDEANKLYYARARAMSSTTSDNSILAQVILILNWICCIIIINITIIIKIDKISQ